MLKELKFYAKDNVYKIVLLIAFVLGTTLIVKGFSEAYNNNTLTVSMVVANSLLYMLLVYRMPIVFTRKYRGY